jgi:rod shape-determining protein MreC
MARRSSRRGKARSGWLAGVAVVALAGGALWLALGSSREGEGGIRGLASDVGGGIGSLVGAPVRWFQGIGSGVSSHFGSAEEVRRLRAENAALVQWRDQARSMAERLDAYEKLNAVQGEPIPQGLTGRMVSESEGPFSHTGIVNVGARQGIKVNWVAINGNGLVGRVISVGDGTARILLLTDGDSRVPVMGELTRARAILTGDKTAAPQLGHLNLPAVIREGERLLTSGDDGLIPRGIAVGEAATGPDGRSRVRLATAREPLDFVRLVPPSNFPPPLEPAQLPPLAPPPTGAVDGVLPGAAGVAAGGILPGAPGAAAVPAAATPEAIRAAQQQAARQAAEEARLAREALRRAEAERDSLRAAAARGDQDSATSNRTPGRPAEGPATGQGVPVPGLAAPASAPPAASPPPPAPSPPSPTPPAPEPQPAPAAGDIPG